MLRASRGLVSRPFLFPSAGWRPKALSPLVSHCLSTCAAVLDGASAVPRSCRGLSSIGACSSFRGLACACRQFSPYTCARVGWRVYFPTVLPFVSYYFRSVVSLSRPCLFLFPSLPVSPIVSHVPSCFAFPRSCPSMSVHVLNSLPLSPHILCCACVGWCVRLSEILFPLGCHCLVLACLPACVSSCFPLWEVVSFCIFLHTAFC